MNKHLLLSICVVLFFACKREVITPQKNTNLGYDFYPVHIGHRTIYDVERIVIDAPVSRFDTTHYQLKEVISDTFLIISKDEIVYILKRFTRDKNDTSWRESNQWTITKSNSFLVRTEENIPYISLVFPPELNKQWDRNARNTLGYHPSQITSFNVPDTIGTNIFDSTLTVMVRDDENLVNKQHESYVYARGVGLVAKTYINIESQSTKTKPVDISLPIMKRVTKGTIETWFIHQ